MNQPLVETNATAPGAASTRDILVDIRTAGEYINISACGAADANILSYVIQRPSGIVEPTFTTAAGVATTGRIACNNTMTAALATPYRYQANEVGTYKVRLINATATNFNRFDITVTSNNTTNPDPTGNTGIRGRVSSLVWTYATGSFAATAATDANYYTLTPGGFPNTNYVWLLDLNQMSGNGYSITSNNLGVAAPRSGFSTNKVGNSSTPLYRVYVNYPGIAAPPPSAAPSVTGFRFIDSAGQDYGISPGGTAGAQDSGNFEFTTNATGATYAISIDVNKNGIFGDSGDVVLTGNAANGFNSVTWDGRNNAGVILPVDTYQARGEIRLGEFHFIGDDIETSGGTANGLTIYQALSQTNTANTEVYWDDVTVLTAAAGGTANTPLGALSGTPEAYHTWGNFTSTGFGNDRFIDTYVYGERTQASLFVAIVNDDNPLTGDDGVVSITPTSTPGDTLSIGLTDADLNSLSTVVETIVVQVVNARTGQSEAVTLTETGPNTGIFTGTLATAAGAASNGNNSGTMNTQNGDTVRVSYYDALTSTGGNTTRTADDTVSAAASVVTPTNDGGSAVSGATSTAVADVTDNDLINGAPAVLGTGGNAIVSQVSTSNPGVTLDPASGAVNVAATVPPGSYTLTYRLCDLGTPATCANADATITVSANIAPVADSGGATSGTASTPVADVTDNDLVNGAPAVLGTAGNATISQVSTGNPGVTLDPATGAVNVAATVPPGSYTLTYRLCDLNAPVNCTNQDATITVAASIAPVTESGAVSAGIGGSAIANVTANDRVNGAPATLGTGGNAVLSSVSATNAGITLDPATGEVTVAASVPVGSYTLRYQICDRNTPANCATQDDTVTVSANVAAVNDSGSAVSGFASNAVNVLGNDLVNGSTPTLGTGGTATLSQTASSNPGLQLNPATGDVTVAANVPAGSYTLDYQLCDRATPANCMPARVTVTVALPAMSAADDTITGLNGAAGAANVLNLFGGDTNNAVAATATNTTLSVASGSTVPAQLSFDPATGNVSVNPGTPAGTYSFTYSLCDPLNAGNCVTARASVTVAATAIATSPDSATGVDGAAGATNVVNVFSGDQIGGMPAASSNAILSVAIGSSVPAALNFDPGTGNVSVGLGTPVGTYSFQYQICERAVPSNCKTETVSVTVASATLVATDDTVSGVNGASGTSNVINAFTGDTVNGTAATPATAILSVATGFTVPAGLTFDPASGNVSVDPGTPAGSYSFDYQLCERLNPGTCTSARITVIVAASAVVAAPDTVNGVNGATGDPDVGSVLASDTINGAAATLANSLVSLAPGATLPAGLTFNPATGVVGVASGTAAGSYGFDYQICERLNPTRCEIARFTVNVVPSAIVAAPDSASGTNGASGATDVVNAFIGDIINGAAATPANAILSVATGSSVPAGLAFDPAFGNVSVNAGTPAGVYSFDYQICERLNPGTCTIATISVTVVASVIVATPDTVSDVNGATGNPGVGNVLTGDTINGVAATLANSIVSLAPGATLPAGLTFNPATGVVGVASSTPAGSYSFDYQICERLNPTRCETARFTVNVAEAVIVAAPDTATGVNGATGNTNVLNILGGDSINGAPATPANAILSVAAASTVPAGLSFDLATGVVGVAPGTPAGVYTFQYQICERLNPTNCKTATISITVDASDLTAVADSATGVNGATGAVNVLNVLTGDLVNGVAATPSNATLRVGTGSTVPAGLNFDPATGNVSVAAGTPAGTYAFVYEICERLNPASCNTANASVTVAASAIVAAPDTAGAINGATGNPNVLNVFGGDSVNGAAATPANAILSVAPGSSVPSGLNFEPATGIVSVAPGTPAGPYSFSYQICERLNPTNCRTEAVTVNVAASPLTAVADNVTGVNGATGAANVLNVLASDIVNGAAATPSNATLGVATGSTVPAGLSFDPATGNVSVAAGTPVGIYAFVYEICEALNPANCKTANASVTVAPSAVAASPDTARGVNGGTGNPNVLNVLGGDSVNGAAATPANSILSVALGSSVPAGLSFNPATGVVGVAPATPAGSYNFEYLLCERLNPDNCRTETVTINVASSSLTPPATTPPPVNGATGNPNVANGFSGGALNGQPATPGGTFLQLVPGTNVPNGLTFDLATGNVGVAPGTPSGTYTIPYQLCETLNPTNCVPATITVTVAVAPVVAVSDSVTGVNGANGAANVLNVLTADTINGVPATPANGILSVVPGSSIPATLTFDPATGSVGVRPGTPAGPYSFTYQLCEKLNPDNCKTAEASVTAAASGLALVPQTPAAVNGTTGNPNVGNVLTNATINGNPVSTGSTFLQLVPGTTVPNGLTFDLATGAVGVSPGTPAGTYTIQYQLCETLNPTNCVTSSITVTVAAAPLVAAPDQVTGINGATGNPDALNVFGGDTLNGAPATPANNIVRVAPGTTAPSVLTFDPATGVVGVRPGTPAGTYTLDYQICERLNPDNCQTARATVGVAPSRIAAPGATVGGINGSTGNPNVGNAFTGATLNGQPATPNGTFLQLAPGTTVPQGLTFDLATGNLGVAPGTPAGTYVIRYQLCETLNPTNCVDASVSVTVVNPSPVGAPDAASVVTGNPVTIAVLGNDRDPDGDPLTVRSTTSPAHGQLTVKVDGTITYVPTAGYTGTDSFTYTVCDPSGQCATQTVTVTVHPAVSALNGTVYLDLDADGSRDANEPLQPNWVVEVVRDGQVLAMVRTDSNGFYEVPNLPLGSGYSVVFRHPSTNVVYGTTTGIALNAGVTTVDLDRPIDPSGVVYDSIARTPIAGARLTLVDASGNPLPVACFVDPSQQNQLTGADGRYRFDVVPGRATQCPSAETVYRIVIAGPTDTLPGASTIILPEAGALDPTGLGSPVAVVTSSNAPQVGETPRYFYEFRLASGDGDLINNHIPLDRLSALAPLGVTKTSIKRTASVGDLIPYTITIRNTQTVARNNVDVVDTMPAGFRFVEGSARLGNTALAPVVSGRELGWRNLSIPANGSMTISLVLTPGSSVTDGDAVNLADARDARSGRILSNQGQATVRITPSPLFDCSEIIGKVFEDLDGNGYQDEGEPGVAAARVVTANGLLITADQYGRYHVACAAVPNANIGSNFILKLDPHSVPTGTRITTENPRVIRLTRGKISEMDFGVQKLARTTLKLGNADFTGTGEPTPELNAKIGKLAETLIREPATVVLHFESDKPDDATVSQSLKTVAQMLESAWRQAGGKEQLKIERRAGPARPVAGKE